MQITNNLKEKGLVAAVCVGSGTKVGPSSLHLQEQLQALVAKRKAEEFPPPAIKEAVRALLKTGGFKPSGRNKPASEYLAQAAREDRFPLINNLVDINNLVSLKTGLPISLLDTQALGDSLLLRYGRAGERYVFNSGGQEIDLCGLICACARASDVALGNPIKDSMTGKIKDTTSAVAYVIYAPASMAAQAEEAVRSIAQLLQAELPAGNTETLIA